MLIKLSLNVEIDEKKFPNLTKTEIREVVKAFEDSGHVTDYVLDVATAELEELNFEKQPKFQIIKYYHRPWKSWVAYVADMEGNQVSESQYGYTKKEINAFKLEDFRMYT